MITYKASVNTIFIKYLKLHTEKMPQIRINSLTIFNVQFRDVVSLTVTFKGFRAYK